MENQIWDSRHTGPWGLSSDELCSAIANGMVQGAYAGAMNAADKLTFTLIPALHNYRNQVWQDYGLAGTGWETASNAFAWTGTACVYLAGAAEFSAIVAQPSTMEIAFGPGQPYGFHVTYLVRGIWMEATGESLGNMTIDAALSSTIQRQVFKIVLPVLFENLIPVEGEAWSCLTAALHAWANGMGWPW